MKRRLMPAIISIAVTLALLTPGISARAQSCDENWYLWGGNYYGSLLLSLDLRNPEWQAERVLSAPLAVQLYYAGAAALFGAPPPAVPAGPGADFWLTPDGDQPDALVPEPTLLVARLASVVATAIGLAALSHRFGWAGAAAGLLLLLMPNVSPWLARVMAEGPLLMALGLSLLALGTPWLPLALALAANMKLTALALWFLLLWPRASGRLGWWGVPIAVAAWSLFNPASWVNGGPAHLFAMIAYRVDAQVEASEVVSGFYLPHWYLVPAKYALVCAFAYLLSRALRLRRGHQGRTTTTSA